MRDIHTPPVERARLVICGGRYYYNYPMLEDGLLTLIRQKDWYYLDRDTGRLHPHVHIIHGGKQGADALAQAFAVKFHQPFEAHPADWQHLNHKTAIVLRRRDGSRYDVSAGLRQNEHMAKNCRADWVIAFPGDSGTAHMLRMARKYKVPYCDLREIEDYAPYKTKALYAFRCRHPRWAPIPSY